MKPYALLLLLLWGSWRCQAQPTSAGAITLALDAKHTLRLLDSTEAATALLVDTIDHFFERVTAVEMSIQMKKPLQQGQNRDELLPAFQDYLQRDAATFSREEADFVLEVMREAWEICRALSPDLFPDTLLLIKIKGKPYGPSVYYTRQKAIIIPHDVLQLRRREDFLNTMFHELFHVYSRYHPHKRAQLYRRIGFEAIGMERLRLPSPLAQRILHNPDGVDFAQKITLTTPQGKTLHAVPIIYANHPGYTPQKRLFFTYLEFSLFEIAPADDGHWEVLTQSDGISSTLDMSKLPDFYRQIGDNTTYIIHPEEVIADNFALLMAVQKRPATLARLSEAGQQLVKDVEAILRH